MKLEGALDLESAADLAQGFRDCLSREGPLEIDGSGLTEIDGCGLQLLLAVTRSARDRNMEIHWKATSASLVEAAGLLGLSGQLGLKEQT